MGRGWNKIRDLVLPFRAPSAIVGEARAQTLAERLGHGPDARLLIVHADDLGLAQAVNSAFISGVAAGLINSGSVMVPGPWFAEVARFAEAHPEADIGLHLTLSSEGATQRWAPIASPREVPSLVDRDGYFLEGWTSETRIDPREVEIELRAQIDKAYAAGLRPTHLDSHQFRLQMKGRDLFEVLLALGRAYRLPVLVAREWFARFPYLQSALGERDVVLDRTVLITPKVPAEQWAGYYRRALEQLSPGVTEFIIHPGYDNEELRAFFDGQEVCGAAWRQRDLDFFTSDAFRTLLTTENITLVTWREIAAQLQ